MQNINAVAEDHTSTERALEDGVPPYDLLCFSHLRWDFVQQRPHHLLRRCAREHRVFYWEEPVWDGTGEGFVDATYVEAGIMVARPHLPEGEYSTVLQRKLLSRFIAAQNIDHFVSWYYTPMALGFTSHLKPEATVYDCMDELSHFLGAPPDIQALERQLLKRSDVVFTGGISLYEAKKQLHSNMHACPSSIDVEHFALALDQKLEPVDQSAIGLPRAGFYGVLDERFDAALLDEVARLRPHIQFVMIGPTAKIDPGILPRAANIHYLGPKTYQELPQYLGGWDVALLPFSRNESTRFISPTKTPEYLAAGKTVVSTPIHDVVQEYGDCGLVSIASTPEEFAVAIDKALLPQTDAWRSAVSMKLAANSWDATWGKMCRLIEKARRAKAERVPLIASNLPSSSFAFRSSRTEKYDYLVVGAGLAGGVLAERLATDAGKRVLLVDKRDHVGGNTYDYHDQAGILVHKYGPHIFHTNSDEVVRYLSRFTEWHPYEHRVLASIDGMLLPIPINLDTINKLYSLSLDAAGMRQFLAQRTVTPAAIRTSEDICVSRVGRELYEKFFKNYTRKQWGLDPSELDSSVAGRIPVRFDDDDRYFGDTFQAMPKLGYTRMFERMLDHSNITIRTGVTYSEISSSYPGVETIFTGPVDEFFDYRFGPLPYRSLEFRHEIHNVERFQAVGVVNYPNEHSFTRITEFKHLTGQVASNTSVVKEFPRETGDPYYPIPRPENAATYAKYKELADRTAGVHFVGRLATYKYYNMDQVVAQALALYKRINPGKALPFLPDGTQDSLLAEAR